jgi:hypothetical protein
MHDIIDRALRNYELTAKLNAVQITQSRERVARYIEKLRSAGRTDPDELTECARAYLREMHEGQDPRFTGC